MMLKLRLFYTTVRGGDAARYSTSSSGHARMLRASYCIYNKTGEHSRTRTQNWFPTASLLILTYQPAYCYPSFPCRCSCCHACHGAARRPKVADQTVGRSACRAEVYRCSKAACRSGDHSSVHIRHPLAYGNRGTALCCSNQTSGRHSSLPS